MKMKWVVVILWFGLVVKSVMAGDGVARVLVSGTGQIRFETVAVAEKWADTGLTVTAEAEQYPEVVKQLIGEKLESVPIVRRKVTNSRMVGLLTWKQTTKASSVVARDGKIIIVRSATEAEAVMTVKTITNPFGLIAGLAIVLLAGGYFLSRRNRPANATFVVAAAFAVAVAAVAVAAFAVAAFAVAAFAAAAFAAAAFAAAAFAAAAFASDNDLRQYRRWNAASIILLVVSIVTAIV